MPKRKYNNRRTNSDSEKIVDDNKSNQNTSLDEFGPNKHADFKNINYVAPGMVGLDYYANQSALPVGDKGSFPSQPKGVSVPIPMANLGALIVSPALLEARDNGKGWENKVTYLSGTIIYSNTYYRVISDLKTQASFIPVVPASQGAVAPKQNLLYSFSRDDKCETGVTAFSKALNLSAANNLQFIQYQAYATDKSGKIDPKSNSNFLLIGQGVDPSDPSKTVDRKYSVYQAIVDVYEQSLFNAANFVYQIRMLQTLGHALIKKYPAYKWRIGSLIAALSKATIRNIVNSVSDCIANSYFNFNDWNMIVKFLAIPASFGDGADRPLLTVKTQFLSWSTITVGVPSSDVTKGPVSGTVVTIDPQKLILSGSNFISDALEQFVFATSPDQDADADKWIAGKINQWKSWAQLFRSTFLQFATAVEYFRATGNQFGWSEGWEFLPAWGASTEFDAYMLIPELYELAATSSVTYNPNLHAYQLETWYNREFMMPKLLMDQGYFPLWPSQGALIAQAKTPVDKALSKLTMTTINSRHGFNCNESPDITYDATSNRFITKRDDKIFANISDNSLWVDAVSEYIPTIDFEVSSGNVITLRRATDLVPTTAIAQNIESFMDVWHSSVASPFPVRTSVTQFRF